MAWLQSVREAEGFRFRGVMTYESEYERWGTLPWNPRWRPMEITPAEKFLDHVRNCAECQSQPGVLCEEALRLLIEAMEV